MNKQKDKHLARVEPQQNQEDRMAFWDLCRKANTKPQLVNKLQRMGIVQAPGVRRRGLRQLYDMGAFSEVIAGNFLKQFFTLREVAEIKNLEHAILEFWKSDTGTVMNRAGSKLCWKFFFIKELRFSFYKGWEDTAKGKEINATLTRYNNYRAMIVQQLMPLGEKISVEGWEDCLLKKALSGPLSVETTQG